jgi:hypothetical protein
LVERLDMILQSSLRIRYYKHSPLAVNAKPKCIERYCNRLSFSVNPIINPADKTNHSHPVDHAVTLLEPTRGLVGNRTKLTLIIRTVR